MRAGSSRELVPLLLLIPLLSPPGCVDLLEQFTFDPDGSGAYRTEASVPSALAGSPGDELQDWAEETRTTSETIPGAG